jgi:hypothetical protein
MSPWMVTQRVSVNASRLAVPPIVALPLVDDRAERDLAGRRVADR